MTQYRIVQLENGMYKVQGKYSPGGDWLDVTGTITFLDGAKKHMSNLIYLRNINNQEIAKVIETE